MQGKQYTMLKYMLFTKIVDDDVFPVVFNMIFSHIVLEDILYSWTSEDKARQTNLSVSDPQCFLMSYCNFTVKI